MLVSMERLKIFSFWEPRGNVTPYVQLCRETWDKRLMDFEIVDLDHSNLEEYLGAGTLDLNALKQVGLAAQKDAVMIAVLHRHGGLFMDMDTLVVDDLSPILQLLRRTGVVMFEQHVAFVAARKDATLITLWLAGVKRNLARISSGEVHPASIQWDYLGNAPMTTAYLELIDRSILLRMIRRTALGRRFWPSAATGVPQGSVSDIDHGPLEGTALEADRAGVDSRECGGSADQVGPIEGWLHRRGLERRRRPNVAGRVVSSLLVRR